jgi:hypothetical protein
MAGRKKSFKIPGVSFSAKRALGITKAKRNFTHKTGIPTTKAGMQQKLGKVMTGGDRLLFVLSFAFIVSGVIAVAALFL